MKANVRIVAGSLRGRRIEFLINPDLRPTPDMVREALFSILGNAIPGRVFVDIFGGTGVVGLEALSRGASQTLFIERDLKLASCIEQHVKAFGLVKQAKLYRTDAYRWAANWNPPAEPVNIFLSPPFVDLEDKVETLTQAIRDLQAKIAPGSVIVLQSERNSPFDDLPEFLTWERRNYSRNVLFIWQKEEGENVSPQEAPSEEPSEQQ